MPDPPTLSDDDVRSEEDVQLAIEEQLSAIYPRLVEHAISKARRLRSVRGGQLPNGHRAEDAVQIAVTKAWDGERTWNARAYPELIDFLASVVDSVISNLVSQAEHKHRGDLPPDWKTVPDPSVSSLDKLADDECADVLARAIEDVTADDDALRDIMTEFMDGRPPGEIASELSKDPDDVYNAIRKVKRRLAKALDEHPCWTSGVDR